MSPRTGRPPKVVTKNVSLGLRLTTETSRKLQWCADELGISRTEVIENGIDLVFQSIRAEGRMMAWGMGRAARLKPVSSHMRPQVAQVAFKKREGQP